MKRALGALVLLFAALGPACRCDGFDLDPSDFACGSNVDCADGVCFDGVCAPAPTCFVSADCPAPLHAEPRCGEGLCKRGPCEPGFHDLDGTVTFGCEAGCVGNVLTDGAGKSVEVKACPPPESGATAGAFATTSSFGEARAVSSDSVSEGVMGEPFATPLNGASEQRSPNAVNHPGLGPALEQQ